MSEIEEVEEAFEVDDWEFSVSLTLQMDDVVADLYFDYIVMAGNASDARATFIDIFNSMSLSQLAEQAREKGADFTFLPHPQFGAEAAPEQMALIEAKLASGFNLDDASITEFEADGIGPAGEEVLIETSDIG